MKKCGCCEKTKPGVAEDSGLCVSCESEHVYCSVCDEWTSRESDGCRHVEWVDEIGYCGCGFTEIAAADHKDSFFLLLDRFAPLEETYTDRPKPLIPTMKRLIRANNFWTCWYGPLIGAPPALNLKYKKDFGTHASVLTLCEIQATTQKSWGHEAIESMQLGMAWLCSLDAKSIAANKLTVEWIREWERNSDERSTRPYRSRSSAPGRPETR